MSQITLSSVIADYIANRKATRIEAIEKEFEKERQSLRDDPDSLAARKAEQSLLVHAESEKYVAANWLDDAAKRAKQIMLVTHAPKFTHGDAKGAGIFANLSSVVGEYVGTSVLSTLTVDVIGNAAALDVANLLLLETSGVRLVDALAQDDVSPLRPFARNEEQLTSWLNGFRQALESNELSTHRLSKQLYFPTENGYHIIGPLFATSFAHAIYECVEEARFSDAAKTARTARREKKYHETAVRDFPGLAVQTFGGTKPQNVSLLNSRRRGKAYLLNCQPPNWRSKARPPEHDYAFWSQFGYHVRHIVRELKDFLISIVDSESTLDLRQRRAALIAELVSELHQFSARVRLFPSGWSRGTLLSEAMSIWLDPYRQDEAFLIARDRHGWEHEVGTHFARWLNEKLQNEHLQMKDSEYQSWTKLLTRELRLFTGDLGVTL